MPALELQYSQQSKQQPRFSCHLPPLQHLNNRHLPTEAVQLPSLSSWIHQLEQLRLQELALPESLPPSPMTPFSSPQLQHLKATQESSPPANSPIVLTSSHQNCFQRTVNQPHHTSIVRYGYKQTRPSPSLSTPPQEFLDGNYSDKCPSSPCQSSCDESKVQQARTTPPPPQPANIKKYHCDWEGCGRDFKTAWHLMSHTRHHTNLRTFHCESCPLTFTRKHDLMRHARTVHASPDGEPQFACKLCFRGFGRLDSLKRHTNLCKKAQH